MSYQIKSLLDGLSAPVSVHIDQPIQAALDLMVLHDFSQLPVEQDEVTKDRFLVTSNSILVALADFGPQSYNSGLLVRDALKRVPQAYHAGDDLFDLLEGMHNLNAALIVDEDDGKLTHIVTSYDTTQYFRQWSEATMHARDVEKTLKRYLQKVFTFDNGNIDEDARQTAIESITSSNKDLRKKFDQAVKIYLKRRSEQEVVLNKSWMEIAFINFPA